MLREHVDADLRGVWTQTRALRAAVKTPTERLQSMESMLLKYVFAVPKAIAPTPMLRSRAVVANSGRDAGLITAATQLATGALEEGHIIVNQLRLCFPDKWLVQYDCGKLQVMVLLHFC